MIRCRLKSSQSLSDVMPFMSPFPLLVAAVLWTSLAQAQMSLDLDLSTAKLDPATGKFCVMQKVCTSPEDLANLLPRDPCFPPGCNCNTAADCKGGEAYCNDCLCSDFPPGCNCDTADDCGSEAPFCNDCVCNPFPFGCDCNADGDCPNSSPYCVGCKCSGYPEGCNCNDDGDCDANDGTPFCVDCTCGAFPPGCDCNGDSDCGDGFCVDCNCNKFRKGCNCNEDDDCGDGFCVDCSCSNFPEGCSCNSDSDCGGNSPFCVDCNCNAFPEGCDCNSDSDCGDGFCVDCTCDRFPKGCNCLSENDCGGAAPYCSDCQCSAFPPGCSCNSEDDCGPEAPNCNDCNCSRFPPGCDCEVDGDCGGGDFRCLACVCKDCPISTDTSNEVINPPLTFVVDTTKSVKPDKFSIFNLTQRVVERIVEIEANIPRYTLITFNDYGPNFRQNVDLRIQTQDVVAFKQEIIALRFESFDGGRDSKERLMQGLLAGVQTAPAKSLVVVFTDNGSKDLNLRREIIRIKRERQIAVYIVLTPIFEGFPNDPSLGVYEEVSDELFFINEVGVDVFLSTVQNFEKNNCV